MFFLLSKLLLFLTKPFIWILLLLLFGLIFKNSRYAKRSIKLSLILLIFFTNTVILLEFSRLWEVPGKKIQHIVNFDCAIVLTGMASYNNDLKRLELGRHGDRVWQAVDLYHRKKVKKILISGDSGSLSDRGLHEAKQLGEVLKRAGIPSEDLIIEGKSQNTYQNALYTTKLIKEKHPELKKLLLVTSSTHMRRSLGCFEKQGLECTPFSVGMWTGPKRGYYFEQFIIPSVHTLENWETLTKEWTGYLMYKMMGYL
jgi:uncharacterized SAM-binding protein YcdF (DUF218 family)